MQKCMICLFKDPFWFSRLVESLLFAPLSDQASQLMLCLPPAAAGFTHELSCRAVNPVAP